MINELEDELNREPTSFQWPAVASNVLLGQITGAEHFGHLPKHGNEGQEVLRVFNIHPRSFTQVLDPFLDEGGDSACF
jgi:hypothetical protein